MHPWLPLEPPQLLQQMLPCVAVLAFLLPHTPFALLHLPLRAEWATHLQQLPSRQQLPLVLLRPLVDQPVLQLPVPDRLRILPWLPRPLNHLLRPLWLQLQLQPLLPPLTGLL